MAGTFTITHLDLSNNTKFQTLICNDSYNLGSIDVSKNVELTSLDCSYLGTQFKQIDLSNNVKLKYLYTVASNIQNLDLSENGALERVNINGSSEIGGAMDLTKMKNINEFLAYGTSLVKICVTDAQLTNYQNHSILIGVDSEDYITADCHLSATNIISNNRFRNILIELGCDTNHDNYIQKEEVDSITDLDIQGKNISRLEGIQYFTELTSLNCSNNAITSLLFSGNSKLEKLYSGYNDLISIDLSYNKELVYLDLTNAPYLYNLDISNNTKLETLICNDSYSLENIDFSKNTELKYLDCSSIWPQFNRINLSHNKKLKTLIVSYTYIEYLDLSGNTALERGNISGLYKIKGTIDLSKMNNLNQFFAYDIPPIKISISNAQYGNYLNSTLTLGVNSEEYLSTSCYLLASNIIPDTRFRNELIQLGYDTNNDENIQKEEVGSITNLEVQGKGILSFEGIHYFTELTYLDCSNNNLISLDLFRNTKLVKVFCHINKLSSFKISKYKNSTLRSLVISNNELAGTLNLRTSTYLDKLWCYNNQLSNICVANFAKAQTSPNYRKDDSAIYTNNCGWVAREGEIENETSETSAETNIYPNLAKGTLFVRTNEPVMKLIVKSLDGTELLASEGKSQMDISALSAGVYLVEIATANGIEIIKLLVK